MSPIRQRVTAVAAALAVGASALAGHAWANNTGLVVVNDNSSPMVQFYVGNRQVLGQAVGPGQAVSIDANDGRSTCNVMLTAVFADGSMRTGQANVCAVAQYPATARGIPFCPGDPRCKTVKPN